MKEVTAKERAEFLLFVSDVLGREYLRSRLGKSLYKAEYIEKQRNVLALIGGNMSEDLGDTDDARDEAVSECTKNIRAGMEDWVDKGLTLSL